MELSKLIICREDVIIVSDEESDAVNPNRKKKLKTKCVRNVKLTKMTVNRVVPNCYRHRCRSGQHYHRQTSKNTKYKQRKAASPTKRYKEKFAPSTKIVCKTEKNINDANRILPKELCSPITIASNSDLYENISSCSFISSDSDELEDLINITRQRMKDDVNFNDYRLKQSAYTNITQDDYQNISSSEELCDSSIHSMDTVLLYHDDRRTPPRSPDHIDLVNNNIEPMLMYKDPQSYGTELLQNKVPSLSSQEDKDNLSPLYEISGKVFMEHYLNTNFI